MAFGELHHPFGQARAGDHRVVVVDDRLGVTMTEIIKNSDG